jgi:hypothetical protein
MSEVTWNYEKYMDHADTTGFWNYQPLDHPGKAYLMVCQKDKCNIVLFTAGGWE